MESAAKDLLSFDELMATHINFFKYAMNQLMIENLTWAYLVGPKNLIGTIHKEIVTPFDLTKRLLLKGHPSHLTIVVEYFFNNDLEFLKSSDLVKKYTRDYGIEYMVHMLWSSTKVSMVNVSVKKLHGYGHLEEIADLQLGVESYQNKLNITKPQKTFPRIEFKEIYNPSYKPLGVIYEDLNKQKRVIWAGELYKFLDGTLKTVRDELHHSIFVWDTTRRCEGKSGRL
uniref:Uncharacterized protein n=1 Tax=Tanacetum cinerariifolium TaxID=118510 RepID=A0A699JRC9_TANCI|nr:hypothetical protein [Tanacetum cinerariifolium]